MQCISLNRSKFEIRVTFPHLYSTQLLLFVVWSVCLFYYYIAEPLPTKNTNNFLLTFYFFIMTNGNFQYEWITFWNKWGVMHIGIYPRAMGQRRCMRVCRVFYLTPVWERTPHIQTEWSGTWEPWIPEQGRSPSDLSIDYFSSFCNIMKRGVLLECCWNKRCINFNGAEKELIFHVYYMIIWTLY